MIADIEEEYDSFLRHVWQQFPHETPGSVESHIGPGYVYNAVSLESSKFLQDRLQSLEEEKD